MHTRVPPSQVTIVTWDAIILYISYISEHMMTKYPTGASVRIPLRREHEFVHIKSASNIV